MFIWPPLFRGFRHISNRRWRKVLFLAILQATLESISRSYWLERALQTTRYSVNRRINFPMEPTRFELVFSRNDGDVDKTIRVCIELNVEDLQVLNSGENERLNIHAIIQRTGILDHLQIGAHDWHYSGRVLGHRDSLKVTPVTVNGRRVWVI